MVMGSALKGRIEAQVVRCPTGYRRRMARSGHRAYPEFPGGRSLFSRAERAKTEAPGNDSYG